MKESKFTEGPWRVEGDWMIVDSTGRLIAQFEPLNDELSNGNTIESFANAQLIKSAPLLYKALSNMCCDYRHKNGLDGAYDAVLLQAEAALKEAAQI
jgi:hypothetical protein